MPTQEDKAPGQIDNMLEKCSWKVQDTKSFNLHALREAALRHSIFVDRQRIFTEFECRLAVNDELEATVEVNLARAEHLRQLIPGHAFSAELLRG